LIFPGTLDVGQILDPRAIGQRTKKHEGDNSC